MRLSEGIPTRAPLLLFLVVGAAGASSCSKRDSAVSEAHAADAPPAASAAASSSASVAPAASPAASPAPSAPADMFAEDDELGGGSSAGGEGQKGNKRWRDTGVYLDGVPIAMLNFGELPLGLPPVWIEDRVSVDIEPGKPGPGFKIVKQREYRFTDYLRALHVDLDEVKEVHVMGPKFTDSIVVSGAELKKRGKGFLFRFGAEVGGKAIPVVPDKFGNGRSPDKVSAVMIYVDKKPPVIDQELGMVLDGKVIAEVPYFGLPLRGGVRVYQDDRIALHIKRPLLRKTTPAGHDADGTPRWNLLAVLKENGVATDKIVEAWVIRHERWEERLDRAALEQLTFVLPEKGSGNILLGDGKLLAQSISLRARAVKPSERPRIRPGEDF
ncbi:MAG: hypothetical protein IT370_34415 [Deltaproteobacteria bacterium]|nr:hypothetical protein [Deltaproteobacteria bacterium]